MSVATKPEETAGTALAPTNPYRVSDVRKRSRVVESLADFSNRRGVVEVQPVVTSSLSEFPSPRERMLAFLNPQLEQQEQERAADFSFGDPLRIARERWAQLIADAQSHQSQAYTWLIASHAFGLARLLCADFGSGSQEDQELPIVLTRLLFSSLIDAPSKRQNQLFDAILALSNPKLVLAVGLRLYEETAQERSLLLTRSLLEAFGRRAWPVLRRFAASGEAECDVFVGLIANCEGVPERQRVDAMLALAKHPESQVRRLLFEHLHSFSHAGRSTILRALQQDSDAEISDEARTWFSEVE